MNDDDTLTTTDPSFANNDRERPSGSRKGLLFLAVIGVAFAAFVGVRVSGALGTRAESQKQQAAATAETKNQAALPPTVQVIKGKSTPWQPVVPFEGSLSAQREADLGFKAPGRLARIFAKVGDRVTAGKTLATLETNEAQAQLAAAQAQLVAAEAQAALAADAARRTAQVVKSGAQSEATGVQAEKQNQLAEAQMSAARAQAELARTSLANHTLQAPFAGIVTRAPTAPGAVVAPGVPLFHVADLATLKLVGTVSPDDARFVKVGTPVEIQSDDGKTAIAKGQVSAVVLALDAQTKRLPVEATVANNPEQPLLAGSLVRAVLRGGANVTVLSYPHTVLRPGSQNEVLVVRDGRIAVRSIEHTVAEDGSLLVRRGLSPDDAVVLSPWPEAQEGQAVTVGAAKNVAAEASAAKPAQTAVLEPIKADKPAAEKPQNGAPR
ncbi:MAG TPA: efflux RND transporter periplasmic adaptor subunit [Polyangia bacterium]